MHVFSSKKKFECLSNTTCLPACLLHDGGALRTDAVGGDYKGKPRMDVAAGKLQLSLFTRNVCVIGDLGFLSLSPTYIPSTPVVGRLLVAARERWLRCLYARQTIEQKDGVGRDGTEIFVIEKTRLSEREKKKAETAGRDARSIDCCYADAPQKECVCLLHVS